MRRPRARHARGEKLRTPHFVWAQDDHLSTSYGLASASTRKTAGAKSPDALHVRSMAAYVDSALSGGDGHIGAKLYSVRVARAEVRYEN